VTIGQDLTVTLEAQNVPEPGVYGVQLELDYDMSLITVSSVQVNSELDLVVKQDIDPQNGRVTILASRKGNTPGLTGRVTLFTIEATALDTSGQVTFTLTNAKVGRHSSELFVTQTQNYNLEIRPPEILTSNVFGQVVLSGRDGDDYSGALVTLDDTGQNGTTDNKGNYTIPDVVAKSYTSITADAPGYLAAKCTTATIISPETSLASINLLSGDITDDNIVDIADATAIGTSLNATGSGLSADINRDKIVDLVDLILVSRNYLAQGPQVWNCLE